MNPPTPRSMACGSARPGRADLMAWPFLLFGLACVLGAYIVALRDRPREGWLMLLLILGGYASMIGMAACLALTLSDGR